ncbi:MAG: MBL fold metallo-hydrolase [Chloroflexi bacterium]|nr:MBL fold metallo-hydrolase [Chloroflexota bacterium]
MATKQIAPGLFEISLGAVNLFLLESDDGWALIDTGFPNKADQILKAVQELGKQPTDIRHIIVTHAHPDHIGNLAALKRATNATTYSHPADTAIARAGGNFRPLTPAPGFINGLMFRIFIRPVGPLEGTEIDQEIGEGDLLPIAGGLTVLHTPGHCAGHLSFFWPRQQLLFVGDACSNLPRLGWSLGYENIQVGQQSLARLAKLDFDLACFGHGKSILHDASAQFRKQWL